MLLQSVCPTLVQDQVKPHHVSCKYHSVLNRARDQKDSVLKVLTEACSQHEACLAATTSVEICNMTVELVKTAHGTGVCTLHWHMPADCREDIR